MCNWRRLGKSPKNPEISFPAIAHRTDENMSVWNTYENIQSNVQLETNPNFHQWLWTNKPWLIHIMGYDSAVKQNKLPTHADRLKPCSGMSLSHCMMGERLPELCRHIVPTPCDRKTFKRVVFTALMELALVVLIPFTIQCVCACVHTCTHTHRESCFSQRTLSFKCTLLKHSNVLLLHNRLRSYQDIPS